MTPESTKKCLECGEPFIGRADKKFCSHYCRNLFNNKRNAPTNKQVRSITRTLMRNRRILLELNPNGKARVPAEALSRKGFEFTYFTSQYTTRDGAVYHYCFEQGYLKVDHNSYLLVRKKER